MHIRRLTAAKSQHRTPVVFLHGFMGSSADWAGFDFPGDFDCFAVDLPGHGRSIRLPDAAYDFDYFPQLLSSTLVEAGLSKIDLVGYSMGGRLAMEFAHASPDTVRKLVLESAFPGFTSHIDRNHRRTLDVERSRCLQSDPAGFLEYWYEQELFDSLKTRSALKGSLLRERRDGNSEEWARALEGLGPANQRDFRPWLGECDLEISLLTGALDLRYTRIAESLHAHNEQIHHVSIAKAGHNVHLEQPESYLQTLLDILSI